jgi:L-aspartate oxidase
MSRYVAVVRDGSGLGEAAREIEAIAARLEGATTSLATEGDEIAGASLEMVRAGHELRNMVDAAGSIIAAATHRAESRGAHFRSDFPESQPALDGQHSVWINGRWRFGSLAEAWSAPVSSIRART